MEDIRKCERRVLDWLGKCWRCAEKIHKVYKYENSKFVSDVAEILLYYLQKTGQNLDNTNLNI